MSRCAGLSAFRPVPLLIASKHQSLWETFALLSVFDDACFILKRELTWIPLFGWYAIKAQMLPIDRRGGSQVLNQLNERAKSEIRSERRPADPVLSGGHPPPARRDAAIQAGHLPPL